MKNLNKILTLLISVVILNSCTKEVTTKQEYTPPAATMYGTWLKLNKDVSDSSKEYVIFKQNDDYYYSLIESDQGFRTSNNAVYSATDKIISLGGYLNVYSISGDTLIVKDEINKSIKFIRVNNPAINFENWTSKLSISKSVAAPLLNISSSRSFGFNGDNLYFYGNKYGGKVYKFNTLNSTILDSVSVGTSCSNFYKSGSTYYGFSGNNKLGKTTELNSGTYTDASSNILASPYSISYNGTSNIFYAYLGGGGLYSGTEGGAFSILKDLVGYNCKSVVYYNSDEFLTVKNSTLYKIKISPVFSVTKSYKLDASYNLYTVSTNGVDVWAYARNYNNNSYEFLKLNLN